MIQPERFHRLRRVLARRQPDLTVVMERVNKEHNFSAILRNCDAVGVLEVHAVPPIRGDLTVSDETSAGSAKWMKVHRYERAVDIIGILQGRGMQVVAAHPDARAVDFREVDFTRPTGILMGAELYGVSDEALKAADVTAVIPMVGMVRSLNVSVATALLLYEAQRQREGAGMYAADPPRIPEPRFTDLLFEWAYPRLARRYQALGLPYPALGPDGELVGDLSAVTVARPGDDEASD